MLIPKWGILGPKFNIFQFFLICLFEIVADVPVKKWLNVTVSVSVFYRKFVLIGEKESPNRENGAFLGPKLFFLSLSLSLFIRCFLNCSTWWLALKSGQKWLFRFFKGFLKFIFYSNYIFSPKVQKYKSYTKCFWQTFKNK